MTRRDSTIKAVAAALQPKSIDLTKHARARRRDGESLNEFTRTVSGEDAAGALGFAANDWENKDVNSPLFGDSGPGNPLAPVLLRLKYADDRSSSTFVRAQRLLFARYETDPRKRASATLYAVVRAALFEWVHDQCQKCRGRKPGAPKASPCLACGQSRETVSDGEGTREVILGQPTKECPRCFGLGRLFPRIKEAKGMKCNTCANSGRRSLPAKARWRLVSKYLEGGIDFRIFTNRWLKAYQKVVDALRAEDKRLAGSIDIQLSRLDNADTVPRPEKEDIAPSDESDSNVRQDLQGRTAL